MSMARGLIPFILALVVVITIGIINPSIPTAPQAAAVLVEK
jgi:hypothetical protein